MINPISPQWIVYPRSRKLKLPFSRSKRGGERVVAFGSTSLLVELDQTRLPQGVECVSSDPAKQRYAFRLLREKLADCCLQRVPGKGGERDCASVASIEGEGPKGNALARRIRIYNLDSVWDPKVVFLAFDIVAEFPPPAGDGWLLRRLFSCSSSRLHGIGRNRSWDPSGSFHDLTRDRFEDDFQNGLDKWYASGRCPRIKTAPDKFGDTIRYLNLYRAYYATAKLKSSIDGFHPLSRNPAVARFEAQFVIHFQTGNRVTILLHAAWAWPWYSPFLLNRIRGDRLTIERLPPSSNKKLRLAMNCSDPCPADQSAVLTSSAIEELIDTITLHVRSSDNLYVVDVAPGSYPFGFDEVNGAPPKITLRGSSPPGSIAFLTQQHQEFGVYSVAIKPLEADP